MTYTLLFQTPAGPSRWRMYVNAAISDMESLAMEGYHTNNETCNCYEPTGPNGRDLRHVFMLDHKGAFRYTP